jgi:predicted naringenin-chalcone synthase
MHPPAAVYVDAIATAVPPYDFQPFFLGFIPPFLSERERPLFTRLMQRSQIDHRYTCVPVDDGADNFYRPGPAPFPTTGQRMVVYEQHAPQLAHAAASQLIDERERERITHLVVGSCTGFYAPGVDCDLIASLRLSPGIQRRLIGFMGCYAGLSVLQTAHDIVTANRAARVLTVNVELCSLHLQRPTSLDQVLAAAQFADGAAAAIVSAEPRGLHISHFRSRTVGAHAGAITWHITDQGFEMHLDPRLPQILDEHVLRPLASEFLDNGDDGETDPDRAWAIHPGGRSILDAVQKRWNLPDEPLRFSRSVLQRFGNMSSATILFVLRDILASGRKRHGHAMAFGPGLAVESMRFAVV